MCNNILINFLLSKQQSLFHKRIKDKPQQKISLFFFFKDFNTFFNCRITKAEDLFRVLLTVMLKTISLAASQADKSSESGPSGHLH